MTAFIIWTIMGVFFIGMGIFDFFSKKEKPFGFWANAKTLEIENVKSYNRALGVLWMVFGILFILLGIPLLAGQNSSYIVLSILGVMFISIMAMAVYVTVIEKKYRKK